MNNYSGEILTTAASFKLDPDLVAAQVHVESGGDPWAWNPEPAYRYFWDVKKRAPFRAVTTLEILSETPPMDFPCLLGDNDQEWWAQQASWGLLQLIGAVAREHGFRGNYLSELCDPVLNLTLGCKHLSELLDWAKGNTTQALAAYNGGKRGNEAAPFHNQVYASRVLNARRILLGQ